MKNSCGNFVFKFEFIVHLQTIKFIVKWDMRKKKGKISFCFEYYLIQISVVRKRNISIHSSDCGGGFRCEKCEKCADFVESEQQKQARERTKLKEKYSLSYIAGAHVLSIKLHIN